MAEDHFNNFGVPGEGAYDDSGSSRENSEPFALRPQEMSRAEGEPQPPRPREQALPEKDDDRFFDRWVVDKARILGSRAVRPPAVSQLKKAVRGFAEWRSLRHRPAAEQQSLSDRALVAATDEKIKNAQAEAEQLAANAQAAEREAAKRAREAEIADEKLMELPPAMRGSSWDFLLTLFANGVVFGVDIFVIRVALERIPGSPEEQWFTALLLGGGAVVVGDVLGWMAAAGSIRRDGRLRRPSPTSIAFITIILVLAVWFFGQLGDFREFGLQAAAKHDGTKLGNPTFFTIAQILFLLSAAVVCFAYVGRRAGRELMIVRQSALDEEGNCTREATKLRDEAQAAERVAAEAPALRAAAEERIRSRERIAEGKIEHDLKQGEYLENLVDPEYMRERAGVESGINFWQFLHDQSSWSTQGGNVLLLRILPAAATLAAAGAAYLIVDSALIAIVTAMIVAVAFAVALWGKAREQVREDGSRRYVAEMLEAARSRRERATDIERLVPSDGPHGTNGAGNASGNGNGWKDKTRKELEEWMSEVRDAVERSPDADE
jgi:hypothetical protein